VPLTALHAEYGVLDATCAELAAAMSWEQVHRVRPRAPLTCRGCGRGMQAKVSKLGLRFFAHDAAVSRCPDKGETSEHRLLKLALAEAVRAAGWTAELEVSGAGWRADVLGVSPDGRRRVAWQAQLTAATTDALMVVDGAARFAPHWCQDRRRCGHLPGYAVGGRYASCPGHGQWRHRPA
jgi:hypothetical protein